MKPILQVSIFVTNNGKCKDKTHLLASSLQKNVQWTVEAGWRHLLCKKSSKVEPLFSAVNSQDLIE
jgi:hypothetical protein